MKLHQRTTKFLNRVIPSSFVILTLLFITANKAHAGGYDDPNILTEEELASRVVSLPAILSWEKWEKPYISGNNLCRTKNGDVICLPLEIAKRLGEHIYTPKKVGITTKAKFQYSNHK